MSEPKPLLRNPCCGYRVDWMEPMENLVTGKVTDENAVCGQPDENDIGICLNCGTLLWYDAQQKPHIATPREVAAMEPPTFALMMRARSYIKERGRYKEKG